MESSGEALQGHLSCDLGSAYTHCGDHVNTSVYKADASGLCVIDDNVWIACGRFLFKFDGVTGAFLAYIKLRYYREISDICTDGNYIYAVDSAKFMGRIIYKINPHKLMVKDRFVTFKDKSDCLRSVYGIEYANGCLQLLTRPTGYADRAIVEVNPMNGRVGDILSLELDSLSDSCISGLTVLDEYFITQELVREHNTCSMALHFFDKTSGNHEYELSIDCPSTAIFSNKNTLFVLENSRLRNAGNPLALNDSKSVDVHRLPVRSLIRDVTSKT